MAGVQQKARTAMTPFFSWALLALLATATIWAVNAYARWENSKFIERDHAQRLAERQRRQHGRWHDASLDRDADQVRRVDTRDPLS